MSEDKQLSLPIDERAYHLKRRAEEKDELRFVKFDDRAYYLKTRAEREEKAMAVRFKC